MPELKIHRETLGGADIGSVAISALPTLRQLRYLVAVADRLNFTLAAEACFVAQPSLSAGIKELESQLGVQLLERDRSGVMVTPVGREVVARARRLLAESEDLVGFARAAGKPMTGVIRLGAIPTIAPFVLPRLVAAMRDSAPALKLSLREETSARLVEAMRAGELDCAVLAMPYPVGDLHVEPLFNDPLVLITSTDAAPGGRSALPPSAIDVEQLLLMEEGHCLREHTLVACSTGRAHTGDVSGQRAVEASSLMTLVQMVAGGFGVALMPAMALGSGLVESAGLVVRKLKPAPVRGIALISRATSSRNTELAAISAALRRAHQQP